MFARAGRIPTAAVAAVLVSVLLVATGASAAIGDVTEYSLATPGSSPLGIAPGPDGALWFTEQGANRIGRITVGGAISEFELPTVDAGPTSIVTGPDGALWFTEQSANAIGRIDVLGNVTEYPIPTPSSMPTGIAAGPDGALWFTEQTGNRIGRMTTGGQVTEYAVPTASSWPTDIAAGPDGNLWFTERRASRIGRITPAGQVTEVPLAGGRNPFGIAAGPDGAMWFTEAAGNAIGRVTTSGSLARYMVPTVDSNPTDIASGSDGAMWFTEQAGDRLGRVAMDGTLSELVLPTSSSGPYGIAAGQDGNLWFTESSVSAIGRLELVEPPEPTDVTAPVIELRTPAEGAAYLVGDVELAVFACTDEGGSGLASCEGTVPTGDPIDTGSAGVRWFTVSASDGAGNTSTVSHAYLVFADWSGSLLLPPSVTAHKAGTPANLRFDLGGDRGAVLEPGSPTTQVVNCVTLEPTGPMTLAASAGGGVKLAGSRYLFHWKTERSWAGTCRQLVLPFTMDGGAVLRLTVAFS